MDRQSRSSAGWRPGLLVIMAMIAASSMATPATSVVKTVDLAWAVSTSVAVDAVGNPVVGYHDEDVADLKVATCGDPACASGNTIVTVDAAGDVGRDVSVAIGTDGNPVLSYYDFTNKDLKVARCGNATCTSGNTLTSVDTTENVGSGSSIAIGTDGLPVVSYRDVSSGRLKVAWCGDAGCTAGNTLTVADTYPPDTDAFPVPWGTTSIAIGTDDFPVVSHLDPYRERLRVTKCGNAGCTSVTSSRTVDAVFERGDHASIAIGTDGFPVVSYQAHGTEDNLMVAKCANAGCTTGTTITPVDTPGDVGSYSSLAIGADGNPVISYFDRTNGDLKVAWCGNTGCSSGNVLAAVDTPGRVGSSTSIAIGADDTPVVSYWYDSPSRALKVARLPATAPAYRPDGLVSTSNTTGFLGDDLRQGEAGQTKKVKVARGRSKTFFIRGQNDGDDTDSLRVKGCKSSTGFTVTYLRGASGSTSITNAVVKGTYVLAHVEPDEHVTLRAKIKVLSRARIGSAKSCRIVLTSTGDPTQMDAVIAKVTARR